MAYAVLRPLQGGTPECITIGDSGIQLISIWGGRHMCQGSNPGSYTFLGMYYLAIFSAHRTLFFSFVGVGAGATPGSAVGPYAVLVFQIGMGFIQSKCLPSCPISRSYDSFFHFAFGSLIAWK